MGVGQRGPPVRSATGRPQPNQALEPTPYSVRCAPASGRGSPRALGSPGGERSGSKALGAHCAIYMGHSRGLDFPVG